MTDLELRGEDEVVEEELHSSTVFYVKIVRTYPDQVLGLPGSTFTGYVETILDARDQEQTFIPIRGRLVTKVEGQFYENGLYRFLSFSGNSGILGVVEPSLCEAEARQEPKVEVLSDLKVSDHIEVKTRPVEAFYANDGVPKNKVLTTKRRVPTGVETESKAKVELLTLKIVKIVVVTPSELGISRGR